MGDDKPTLNAAEVEAFLLAQPDFLLRQPGLLASLELSLSPEGTISLAQRQHQRLLEKNRQLQEQMHALIDNAHSNTALQYRVHALCLKLLDAADLTGLIDVLFVELKHEFGADEVALRLFHGDQPLDLPPLSGNVAQLHADAPELRSFDHLLGKQEPVCGRLTHAQKQLLFPDEVDRIASLACLPLGHEPCAGLLAIGSQDANRFHADMATDYLAFLGEVFMRILRQFCHAGHGH